VVTLIFSLDLPITDTFVIFAAFYSFIYILVLGRTYRFSKGL